MNLDEIKSKIKGEVSIEQKDLEKHSRDASIFSVTPEAVIYPKDAEDVKTLVKWAHSEKTANPRLSLTARAAGTCMSGGSLTDSISVDFTKFLNHVVEVGGDYAICEPGLYYRDLEKVIEPKGLIYPSFPASKELCAIGGIVANNSGGEKSLTYGQTWKHVRHLNVVLADGSMITTGPLNPEQLAAKCKQTDFEGEVYRKTLALIENNYDLIKQAKPQTSKNSAGYYLWNVWDKKTFDLTKLFVGSQGTLGFVTQATLDLIKPAEKSELLVMFIKDMKILGKLVTKVLEFKPETFESFDDHTFKLAVKFMPQMIKRMKGNIIKLGLLFLPEVWLTLTGGIPKLLLIAEFSGDNQEEIEKRLYACKEAVTKEFGIKTHVSQSEVESQKYWTMRRESFSLLREKVKDKHTAPFIDDVAVPVNTLPQFLPELDAIFAQYPKLIYTVAGHAGDANFHIIPLMNLLDANERDIILPMSDKVYDLVLKYHGSITAEHNDGIIRGPYLEKMFGSKMFELFKEVKQIFDPQNIFNPHKKTDSDFKYLKEHIKGF